MSNSQWEGIGAGEITIWVKTEESRGEISIGTEPVIGGEKEVQWTEQEQEIIGVIADVRFSVKELETTKPKEIIR